jgi:hypothetical protein
MANHSSTEKAIRKIAKNQLLIEIEEPELGLILRNLF